MLNNHNLRTPVTELRAGNIDAKPITVNGWDGDEVVNDEAWSFFEYTTVTMESGEEVEVVVRDYSSIVLAADETGRMVEINGGTGGYIPNAESYVDDTDEDDENALTAQDLEDLESGDIIEASAEGPMMNYWYPVDVIDESNAAEAAYILRNLPLVVVMVDDQWGIALSGGGMDLTWEIAAAYCALGMLPPVHFADLPRMAHEDTTRNRYVFIAMHRSLSVMQSWMVQRTERLARAYPEWPTA